ncbi:MAG: HlyD family type I secretion periplasmic adaptor subunit [Hyphomicrobiaceae bacterium]|nr:HlyD family type I secretion periplasmic adaptor subunit [Hyphomicrobiaceae bacterium]MCC0009094.1 HlyD family type I secretion periplasmic adaptor subunit [Hyphomicrobiaceae bacterium]
MSKKPEINLDRSIRSQIAMGVLLALILTVGLGGWSAVTEIDGAVIAPATVVVESSKKEVQHDTGGIVNAIFIKEGDLVRQGDVLLRLDGSQLAAEIAALEKRQFEYLVRRARLSAERDGKTDLDLSAELGARAEGNVELAEIVRVQANLLKTRVDLQQARKSQLEERILQLDQEITGLEELNKAHHAALALFEEELDGIQDLRDRQLVNFTRYNALKRSVTDKRGAYGQTLAEIARTKGKIGETRLQIIDLAQSAHNDALKELESVESELAQLTEKLRAAHDRQSKLNIAAPETGYVHELIAHTIGGVIKSGDRIAFIVPTKSDLVLDAAVQTIDRDQIYPGMEARVRFSAFSQRSTPELYGKIERIASDRSGGRDHSAPPFYAVRIALEPGEIKRLGGLDIVAGMPAEVMMTAHRRTVLSYLMKPVMDQISRAFRDE